MFAGVFEVPAWLLSWFYSFSSSYVVAIGLIAVVVMALVTPLTLKSTKGMLEMQRLAPEMRRLQQQHRNDRVKLNEEMMKLYQEHKVNPMASCLPLLAQMPVFIVMFRILHGLTYEPNGPNRVIAQAVMRAGGEDPATTPVGFLPRYLSVDSDLYQSLMRATEMKSLGLDLSLSPAEALGESIGKGIVYALIVVLLGTLYFFQQRMVAARAAVSPTMSPAQQKLMQYLPVVFAVFQIFFLLGLVIYYIVQAILRILQQAYITRRFYGHDESLGRQAQRASEQARELAKQEGGSGGGLFAQAKRDAEARQSARQQDGGSAKPGGATASKRTTPPKNRPTPASRPTATAASGRPGGPAKRKKKR